MNDGSYRCPSSQQGYSPFTTWTRGLAWILLGYAEQLEFLSTLEGKDLSSLRLAYFPDKKSTVKRFLETARAVADFYMKIPRSTGSPTGTPGPPKLHLLGDYLERPADPYNDFEPVDSSAAAIAAQGLLRLGSFLTKGTAEGERSISRPGLRPRGR